MKHVTDKIQAWLGGELSTAESEAMTEHLQGCEACAAEVRQARELWDLLGTVANPVDPAAPSVWAAVRAETVAAAAEAGWLAGTGRWVQGSLATAALVAGLALGVFLPWDGFFLQGGGGSALAESSDLETYWLTDTSWGASADGYGLAQVWFSELETDEGNGS